jgi:demethylmenaquinone methyltransferase/2-methoxy-6-polyprenyl-1,4-benzoquinol methylase
VGDEDALLAGQIEYYRARAPEYDDWFLRRGHYDHGPELAELWEHETAEATAALTALPLDAADVLELAPGSGAWTDRYVARVASVVGVDASPEMVERAVARLGERAAKVEFVFADIFGWSPPRQFDAVVFCFWISHVPAARLDAFLRTVAAALRPGGYAFFVDTLPEPTSGRADRPPAPRTGEVQRRELLDGRRFDVIKNHWPADELRARFAVAGLDADIRETATYFQYGTAHRPER